MEVAGSSTLTAKAPQRSPGITAASVRVPLSRARLATSQILTSPGAPPYPVTVVASQRALPTRVKKASIVILRSWIPQSWIVIPVALKPTSRTRIMNAARMGNFSGGVFLMGMLGVGANAQIWIRANFTRITPKTDGANCIQVVQCRSRLMDKKRGRRSKAHQRRPQLAFLRKA